MCTETPTNDHRRYVEPGYTLCGRIALRLELGFPIQRYGKFLQYLVAG